MAAETACPVGRPIAAYAGGVNRRLAIVLLGGAAAFLGAGSAGAQEEPPPEPAPATGRTPLVEVPVGCPIQPLPDVVFVGTVTATDYRTARFRIDQSRAGDIGQFAAGELVDVRYGIDTKYVREGRQYLIAAVYDATIDGLRSRVKPDQDIYGGDEIIGATESEIVCPDVVDPMRTIHVDGSSVDSGLLRPLVDDRQGVLRALLIPVVLVVGAVFALASIRWNLTGFGRGVESLTSSGRANASRQPASRQRRPVPAAAGGPTAARANPTTAQRAVQRVQQRSLQQGDAPRPESRTGGDPRARGQRDRRTSGGKQPGRGRDGRPRRR